MGNTCIPVACFTCSQMFGELVLCCGQRELPSEVWSLAACGLEEEGLGLASQLRAQGPCSVAGGETKAQGVCLIAGAGCGHSAKEGPPQTQKESREQNLCLNHLLAASPGGKRAA